MENSLPARYGFLYGRLFAAEERFGSRSGTETAIGRSSGKPANAGRGAATTAGGASESDLAMAMVADQSSVSDRLAFVLRVRKKEETC